MAKIFNRQVRLPAMMTYHEYRAHITGLNIFFGALLGVVMAGTEALGPWDFAIVLLYSAGMVTTILHISASPRRILYAVLAAVLTWLMPAILTALLSRDAILPEKLQPTLAVWVLMMIAIEFVPRGPGPDNEPITHPAEGDA